MAKPKKGMQLQLLVMIGMVAGVMLAGYFALPKNEQERQTLLANLGTTNHGTLISPLLPVDQLSLQDVDGNLWRYGQQKPKWRLLIHGDGDCLGHCREMVYTTRQMHLRLGKHSHRFERVYVADAKWLSEEFTEYLKGHPYLNVLHVRPGEWQAWLQGSNIKGGDDSIAVLVDQGGNAMMYYGSGSVGGEMLEDLNHVLKYSSGQ